MTDRWSWKSFLLGMVVGIILGGVTLSEIVSFAAVMGIILVGLLLL